MTKIKFDVSDQDPEESVGKGRGELPPEDVYTVKIESCKVTKPQGKDTRIEVKARPVVKGKSYMACFDYINLESDAAVWKVDQFLQAFGIATKTKRKGEVDDTFFANKTAKVRIYHDSYTKQTPQGAQTSINPKIGEWIPKGGKTESAEESSVNEEMDVVMHGAAADNGDADSEAYLTDLAGQHDIDPNDYETWEEVANLIAEAQSAEGDTEAEADTEGEEDLEALGATADEEGEDSEAAARLTDLADEAGLDPNDYETWTALAEALGGTEAEEEASDEGGPDLDALGAAADEAGDDSDEAAQLTDLADAAGVDVNDYDTWVEVATALQEAEGSGEGTDWASMGLVDLKREAKERDLPTTGTKAELVQRLTEWEETNPFAE